MKFWNKKGKPPTENIKSNYRLSQYYFFTLSFTYTQIYDDDTISFAHAIPYTYNGHLVPFLNSIAANKEYHKILRIGTFWKTLARNDCKIVTITDHIGTYRNMNNELKWYVNFKQFYLCIGWWNSLILVSKPLIKSSLIFTQSLIKSQQKRVKSRKIRNFSLLK